MLTAALITLGVLGLATATLAGLLIITVRDFERMMTEWRGE